MNESTTPKAYTSPVLEVLSLRATHDVNIGVGVNPPGIGVGIGIGS